MYNPTVAQCFHTEEHDMSSQGIIHYRCKILEIWYNNLTLIRHFILSAFTKLGQVNGHVCVLWVSILSIFTIFDCVLKLFRQCGMFCFKCYCISYAKPVIYFLLLEEHDRKPKQCNNTRL